MYKKDYQEPMMQVVKLENRLWLLAGSGDYTLPDPEPPTDI